MAFVQIMEMHTKDVDQVKKAGDEWFQATDGRNTVLRSVVCSDRNDPGRILNLVFFDSYESAMENSNLPETQALSSRLAGVLDGPPTFIDLDVIDDRST